MRGVSLLLLLVVHPAFSKMISSLAGRESCRHYQHIGCLSDTLEKACMSDTSTAFVGKTAVESVWLCCCPKPYQACAKTERDAKCDAALVKFMGPLEKSQNRVQIQAGIQSARGELQASSLACKDNFAPATPVSKCGKDVGLTRSIARADIFCETVTWQWEQLGDGNPKELNANKCPVPTKAKPLQAAVKGRKGAKLMSNQIPSELDLSQLDLSRGTFTSLINAATKEAVEEAADDVANLE